MNPWAPISQFFNEIGIRRCGLLALLVAVVSCDAPPSAPTDRIPGSSPSVAIGGSRDFGYFRALVDAGQLPSSRALDDVGFFAEHAVQAFPTCEQKVCLHSAFVQAHDLVDQSPTPYLLFRLLSADLPPETAPPTELIVLAELGDSMTPHLGELQRALTELPQLLEADDRLSLMVYGNRASSLLEELSPDDPRWSQTIATLQASGLSNLYDGLRELHQRVDDAPSRRLRVLIISAGYPNAGIVQAPRLLRLARLLAERDVAISTIALSVNADQTLMRSLAELGNGGYFQLDNAASLLETCRQELLHELHPIARQGLLRFSVPEPYVVETLFGAQLASAGERDGFLRLPLLSIAHRRGHDDLAQGRRGGGALFAVALGLRAQALGSEEAEGVLEYIDFATGQPHFQQSSTRLNTPASFDAERAAHIVNVYRRLKMVLELAEGGDLDGAWRLLKDLERGLTAIAGDSLEWAEDLRILRKLADNLVAMGAGEEPAEYRTPRLGWW